MKKHSNYKPEFLKFVHEQRTNKGETGMCMLMAYSTLTHGVKELPVSVINQNPNNIYAVHGKVSKAEGKRFWHAWIEINAGDKHTVFDPTTGIFDDKKHWYKLTHANPGTMNQWETSTNKNNFIYWNFTDGGTETVQWIADFPEDWNSSANVEFTPLWTAQSGSGTVNFTIAAKLFPDDAAIDTALASVGSSVDTLITVGDMHVAPATTGAAITSVSSGGNTAIIKVARNSATDTLSGTAQLLGVRVKYIRTVTG